MRGMRGPLTRQLDISGGEHSNVKRVNCVGRLSNGFLEQMNLLITIDESARKLAALCYGVLTGVTITMSGMCNSG